MNPRFSFYKKVGLIEKGKPSNINFKEKENISNLFILYILIFFVFIGFIIIFIRLFQLTIVRGGYFARLSDENRIKEITIEPKRGQILDRKGFVIAQNQDASLTDRAERLNSRRNYQAGEAMAPLIGYRQTADKEDLKQDNCLNKLQFGDKTGKKGIEKLYECELRGKLGKKLTENDAKGKYLRTITVVPPVEGETIRLAVDLDLQKKAYKLIKDKKASVVALVPQTGEILVMASSPSFDPQAFEDNDTKTISNYFNDKLKPLFNRSSEGTYPPGSIFKLVIAAGALEEKKIEKNTLIEDTGIIKAGNKATFGNWYFLQYGKTDGMVNIVKAIQRSNDIFFYKTGEMLKPENIKKWGEIFGYGKKTGVKINESEGLLPSAFWKEETLKEAWYLGDTYNYSIGQGYTLVTPLQVTAATAVFANGGYLCTPELLKTKTGKCHRLNISSNNLELIRQGMKAACEKGGTGWPLFEFKISQSQSRRIDGLVKSGKTDSTDLTDSNRFKLVSTACKTGTAESHSKTSLPHAWFTVFAPFEKPEIAVTVLIEEGGQGSDIAAPIAKEILKAYFERSE